MPVPSTSLTRLPRQRPSVGVLAWSLAIGAGVRAHIAQRTTGIFKAVPGHDFADCLAAGTLRGKHLIQEGPEGDFQGEEALAAVVAVGIGGQEGGGKVRAEELAKLGERSELWQIGQCLFQAGDRRFSEEKGFESVKERGGKAHEESVYIPSFKVNLNH